VLCAALLAASATAVAFASTGSAPPTIPNCGHAVVAPKTLTLACADANYGLARMSWRRWGDATATGSGVASANDCTPYCAAGHFHTYPVTATASLLRTCSPGKRVGPAQYTLLVLRYPGKRPAGVGRTDTWKFPCSARSAG
jgi:hypothetical protein